MLCKLQNNEEEKFNFRSGQNDLGELIYTWGGICHTHTPKKLIYFFVVGLALAQFHLNLLLLTRDQWWQINYSKANHKMFVPERRMWHLKYWVVDEKFFCVCTQVIIICLRRRCELAFFPIYKKRHIHTHLHTTHLWIQKYKLVQFFIQFYYCTRAAGNPFVGWEQRLCHRN